MRALVYHGAWKEGLGVGRRDPEIIDRTDAIIRVEAVTICGTDLHILKGDVPDGDRTVWCSGTRRSARSWRSATAVTNVRPGDRVLASCITACGRCRYCREGALRAVPRRRRLDPRPHRRRGAGRVRPHSVRGHLDLPGAGRRRSDEDALMLADILPTGYEVGVLNGAVAARGHRGDRRRRSDRPGRDHGRQAVLAEHDVVVDLAEPGCEAAKSSAPTSDRQPARTTRSRSSRAVTGGLGADVALEAVGIPATFELCTQLVRPGGHVANIGVHGKPATLHLEDAVDP